MKTSKQYAAAAIGYAAKISAMRSLRTRLLFAVIAPTTIGFVIAGIAAGRFLANSIHREFDNRLERIADTLIAEADLTADENVQVANVPSAPEFSQLRSGWYWMIAKGGQVAARSRSLWTDQMAIEGLESGRSHVLAGPNGERLRAFVRTFNLGRQSQILSVTVAAPAHLAENEVRTVVGSLIALLGIVGIGSLVTVGFLLNQGLAPLKGVANAVVQISRGEIESIKPTGYREIDPLVGAVSGLIANMREILARSRLHTSNLAHAIKTPLALISARVHNAMPHDPSINESVDLISRHIEHHLKRARFAPTEPVISTSIPVKPVLEDILLVMQRTFHNRSINLEMRTADNVAFLGEREDLEELIGNLVENAYKWAQQRILIEANNTTAGQLVVTVCDDGVGIDDAAREVVLRPGIRLDETVSGYGLGLSIAAELIERYRGQLSLDRSTLGGLKVSVYLPGILTRL